MLALVRRTIPLEKALSIPLAFAVYFVGFPLFAVRAAHPRTARTALAIALFVIGLLLNSVSEVQRRTICARAGCVRVGLRRR